MHFLKVKISLVLMHLFSNLYWVFPFIVVLTGEEEYGKTVNSVNWKFCFSTVTFSWS